MIEKSAFDSIFEKAKNYKYSSMRHLGYEDCQNAEVLYDCDSLILWQDKSKTPAMLYFATDHFERLVKIIADMPGKLRLHFVVDFFRYRTFKRTLKLLGFAGFFQTFRMGTYIRPAAVFASGQIQ